MPPHITAEQCEGDCEDCTTLAHHRPAPGDWYTDVTWCGDLPGAFTKLVEVARKHDIRRGGVY